jgi:adenosylcobinamide-phosphate synthase
VSVTPFELACGVSLDLLLGDPRWMPHPVRAVGWLAEKLERFYRATGLPLRAAGTLFTVTITGVTGALVSMTLPWSNIYWIYSLLAIRSLDIESSCVARALERGDLTAARQALSMIVGRDTSNLDEPEILRGVLETISENFSDAVVAPLFWLIVAGPAGMAVYKAANTLDSMVGYKNDRYRDFGFASARLDDILNFLPARLAAAFVWIGAGLIRLNVRRSLYVTLRDASSQPSPNSGYPEAAFSGALGIRLGGTSFYGGHPSPKTYLGDPIHPMDRMAFTRGRRLLYAASFVAVLFAGVALVRR